MKTDSEKPNVTITEKGVTAKFPMKWILAVTTAFMLGGGIPTLTSFIGITGISSDKFDKHEYKQSAKFSEIDNKIKLNDEAILEIKKTLSNLEAIQRIQVATEEARVLTARIKNTDERTDEFVRLLKLNITRLSQIPPKGTCYNLDCKE